MTNEDLEKKLLKLLKENERNIQNYNVVYNTFIQNAEGSSSSVDIGSNNEPEYNTPETDYEKVEDSENRELEEPECDVETKLENPEARKRFRKLIIEAIELRTNYDLERGNKPIHVEGIEKYISWKKEEGSSKTELRMYLTDLGWRTEQVDFFIEEYYVNPKVKREGFFRRVRHRLRRKSLEEKVWQDIHTEIAEPSEIFPPIEPQIPIKTPNLPPLEEGLGGRVAAQLAYDDGGSMKRTLAISSQQIAQIVAAHVYADLRKSENIPELQIRKEMSERNVAICSDSIDSMFKNYS